MRLSLFTPVHNLQYLTAAFESIRDQAFDEWVIIRNGPALYQPLGFEDPRVKVLDFDVDCTKIGSLKRAACMAATGDILVELDHDDLLVPTALEKIRAAFESDPEIGCVYSNTAQFRGDFEAPIPFNPAHGWIQRPFDAPNGKTLNETVAWEPTPASLSKIWYAPDHVRAFRSDVYRKIGGHNKTFPVCDDQELLMRLYLETKFKHIDECLYLYRVHDGNTWLVQENNQLIQTLTVQLSNHFFPMLCERWANLNGLSKIDLGGRLNKPQGYLSVDLKGADISADLNGRWPFDDNSVGVIRAYDVFEHLPDKLHTMAEVQRVLKPGGYLLSQTPSTDGRGAFQDPTHVSFWNEHSFWYYTKSEFAKYIDSPVRLQTVRLETIRPSEHAAWVMFDALKIDDTVRHPGLVEI